MPWRNLVNDKYPEVMEQIHRDLALGYKVLGIPKNDYTINLYDHGYPLEKTKPVTCKATKIRCFFAALGDALDKAIIEREKQKELEWKVDDLAWIDQVEMWSAFME